MNFSQAAITDFNPEAVAQRVADRQRLADAESMCNSLVADVDGHWLINELIRVRSRRVSPDGRTGMEHLEPRTFLFRSPQPLHNLDPETEKLHYRPFTMPTGFHVLKVSGAGFSTWTLRVHNRLKGKDEAYINLQYNALKAPIIVRYFHAEYDGPTGRRAGARMRGHGPNRSL